MRHFLILLTCAILMACGKPVEADLQPPRPVEVPVQLAEASPYSNIGKFYLHYSVGSAIATPVLYRDIRSCKTAIQMLENRLSRSYNNLWFECTPEYDNGT